MLRPTSLCRAHYPAEEKTTSPQACKVRALVSYCSWAGIIISKASEGLWAESQNGNLGLGREYKKSGNRGRLISRNEDREKREEKQEIYRVRDSRFINDYTQKKLIRHQGEILRVIIQKVRSVKLLPILQSTLKPPVLQSTL